MRYKYGRNNFKKGTTNTTCDQTGFKVKLSKTKGMWDGTRVIPECWEPRDPQDSPVVVKPQKVFTEARPFDEEPGTVSSFDLI